MASAPAHARRAGLGAAQPLARGSSHRWPAGRPAAERLRGADAASLDRRLASLARARAPLRRMLAALAGRLVAARAWERLGFARLRDYAAERAGLSARALQDLAHTDAALARLPRTEAALLAGRISWTKTRLLARVATLDDESRWLALAARTTARALAREVRAVDVGSLEAGMLRAARQEAADGCATHAARRATSPRGAAADTDEDGAPSEPRECVEIRCAPVVRGLWFHACQLARRAAGEPLPPWGCAEAIAAEVLSAISLDAPAVAELEAPAVAELEAAAVAELPPPHVAEPRADAAAELEVPPADGRAAPAGRSNAVPEASADLGAAPADACAGDARSQAPPSPASPATPTRAADPAFPTAPRLTHPAPRTSVEEPNCAPEAADGCARQGGAEACPPELPRFLRVLLEGLTGADAFELDRRLRLAIALEQRLDAELSPLLRRIADRRLHLRLGHTTLEGYARERLGISPRRTRALLRLERAGDRCPALRRAYREGRLSWVQALAIVPLVFEAGARPFWNAWVEHAARVTYRRLEADVERALAFERFDPADSGPEGDAGFAAPELERQTGARPMDSEGTIAAAPGRTAETARIFFVAPRDVARLFRAVLCTTRRRLERRTGRPASAGDALEAMTEHAVLAWGGLRAHVSDAHRVFARDGWRCSVPGCSSLRNLHDHHIVFRAAGGSDALENRTTLCAWHHLRGVHAGIVRCTGRAPHALRFELGLRPDRAPLLRFGPHDTTAGAAPQPAAATRAQPKWHT